MHLKLHRLTISLESENTAVTTQWQRLLGGWLGNTAAQVDGCLCLELVDHLPSLPQTRPLFYDERSLPDDVGILTVYGAENGRVWLHYHDGALVSVPLSPAGHEALMYGYITEKALMYGRFEDVTFTSIAPLLRRSGYYLVHAFAASKDGRAVLIVGPSGSGKTTTGLSLLLAGWQLLANDILLLEARADGIYALPTPGGVNVRPQTFELLPSLRLLLHDSHTPGQTMAVTGQQLTNGLWAQPVPVGLVLFPRIEAARPYSQLQPLNRAVALVQLLAESVDRWDGTMLNKHVNVLQALSRQTAVHTLLLGQDVPELPVLIEEYLA